MPNQFTSNKDPLKPNNPLKGTIYNRTKWTRLSVSFGIFGIISNMLCCLPGGIPISVVAGIFGIAFAFISRKDGKFPKLSKAGIILSSISIVLGFVLFFVIISVFEALKNPETGNYYFHYLEDLINSMPADTRDAIRSFYGM